MSEKGIHVFSQIVIVLVLSLVLVSILSIRTVNAQAGQATLKPSDDTYVDSGNSNSNYGGQDVVNIQNYQVAILGQTYNYTSVAWLKFDLSFVPDGAEVDGAALQLYKSNYSYPELFNVHAYSCSNNSWTELTLTYLNMPSYNKTSMDSVPIATDIQWYNWNVVDAVRNALKSNPKAVTIVLLDPSLHSPSGKVAFYSKEQGNYLPKLAIHWSEVVPEFPTFLILPFFMIATLTAVAFYKKKAMQSKRL